MKARLPGAYAQRARQILASGSLLVLLTQSDTLQARIEHGVAMAPGKAMGRAAVQGQGGFVQNQDAVKYWIQRFQAFFDLLAIRGQNNP
jgi:hypothetical protein